MPPLEDLLRLAKTGDVNATELLVQDFDPLIQKECAKHGLWQHPDWSQADLRQEVILKIWLKLDQFSGSVDGSLRHVFEQWVRKTAQHVLADLHRYRMAKKRQPGTVPQQYDEIAQICSRTRAAVPSASSVFVREEEAERIRRAMDDCLDEQGKQILTLRIVEGLSLRQISERLSITYDQARYKYDKSLVELQIQQAKHEGN